VRTHEATFERADETEVCVEYTITAVVPATWGEPAEGGEVEIVCVTDKDGNPVKWTDEEDDKWVQWIAENHNHWDDYDDYDY
jgi:hypothetical protein